MADALALVQCPSGMGVRVPPSPTISERFRDNHLGAYAGMFSAIMLTIAALIRDRCAIVANHVTTSATMFDTVAAGAAEAAGALLQSGHDVDAAETVGGQDVRFTCWLATFSVNARPAQSRQAPVCWETNACASSALPNATAPSSTQPALSNMDCAKSGGRRRPGNPTRGTPVRPPRTPRRRMRIGNDVVRHRFQRPVAERGHEARDTHDLADLAGRAARFRQLGDLDQRLVRGWPSTGVPGTAVDGLRAGAGQISTSEASPR